MDDDFIERVAKHSPHVANILRQSKEEKEAYERESPLDALLVAGDFERVFDQQVNDGIELLHKLFARCLAFVPEEVQEEAVLGFAVGLNGLLGRVAANARKVYGPQAE